MIELFHVEHFRQAHTRYHAAGVLANVLLQVSSPVRKKLFHVGHLSPPLVAKDHRRPPVIELFHVEHVDPSGRNCSTWNTFARFTGNSNRSGIHQL